MSNSKRRCSGKSLKCTMVAIGIGMLLSVSVYAEVGRDSFRVSEQQRNVFPVGLEIFDTAAELPDTELAQMRGRFAVGNRVMFFGIEMYTRWQAATGEVFIAELNLNVDWDAVQFRPIVTIAQTIGHNKLQNDPTEGGIRSQERVMGEISNGGTANLSGVAQIIQVAGNDNRIHNDVVLDIVTHTSDSIGHRVPKPQGNDPRDPLSNTSRVTTVDNGAVLTTGVDRGSFEVSVTIPDQGHTAQTINSIIGMQQNVRVTGNGNDIFNALRLTAGFQRTSGVDRVNLRATILGLRGLRQQGMY